MSGIFTGFSRVISLGLMYNVFFIYWLFSYSNFFIKPFVTYQTILELGKCFQGKVSFHFRHCILYCFLFGLLKHQQPSSYKYWSVFSFTVIFIPEWAKTINPTKCQDVFILLIKNSPGILSGIVWSVYISKSLSILNVSYSRTDSGLRINYLARW